MPLNTCALPAIDETIQRRRDRPKGTPDGAWMCVRYRDVPRSAPLPRRRWRPRFLLLFVILGAGVACQPEANLDLVLFDECTDPTTGLVPESFQQTRSVRVTLVGEAGLPQTADSANILGCEQSWECIDLGDQRAGLQSFDDLREALRAKGVLLQARPGPNQAIVLTGSRSSSCLPVEAPAQDLTFCGFEFENLRDDNAELWVLTQCVSGYAENSLCWSAHFLQNCP
jgi:hypothetical protein